MEPTLHTSGLGKNYGDFAALAELNLSVSAGEVFGSLGPSGTYTHLSADQINN